MRVNTERLKASHAAYEARVAGSPVLLRIGSGRTQCETPVELHMFGYPDPICVDIGTEPDRAVSQRQYVRCRRCDACMRHRAQLWTARAMDETKVSARTWFGTLTLTPDRQTWARYSALKRMDLRVSEHTEENVFLNSVHILGEELTLFLKRLRKVQRFRYLLVTEQHKSGLPHFHMLIHEYAGSLTKRDIEAKWRFGFSHWRLVQPGDEQACGYVCKYLAKSALTRVRASSDYGRLQLQLLTERVNEATRNASESVASGIKVPVK